MLWWLSEWKFLFVVRHLPKTLAFSSACSGSDHWDNELMIDFVLKPYLGCFQVSHVRAGRDRDRMQLNNARCMRFVSSITVFLLSIFVLFRAKVAKIGTQRLMIQWNLSCVCVCCFSQVVVRKLLVTLFKFSLQENKVNFRIPCTYLIGLWYCHVLEFQLYFSRFLTIL